MVLNQDFKEFIQSLNDNKVRYLIIGGYAVAFHGHPRYIKDFYLWIVPDEHNVANMLKALDQFGFASLGLKAADFRDPDQIIQLGYPPNRIDILTSLAGLDFNQSYASRVETTIDQIVMNFIDLDSLKKNKKATGRFQDLADLEKPT